MERVELKAKFTEALQKMKQNGMGIGPFSEKNFGNTEGKNSLSYRLSVDSKGEKIPIRVDHIWGECEESIIVWHPIYDFNPAVLTDIKAFILQNCWKNQCPNSPFKLAKSNDRREIIFGLKIRVDEIKDGNVADILTADISRLVEEIPQAKYLTKKFIEGIGSKNNSRILSTA